MKLAAAFAVEPQGEGFKLFGRHHLATLGVTATSLAGLVVVGRCMGPVGRARTRRVLAAALTGQEVSYHVWRLACRTWDTDEMLPLHLCGMLVWCGSANLLRPTQLGDDLVWYWGIAGVPHALLTPDVDGHGFPHYQFVQFFVSHGLLLALPLWQVCVEGRRPTAAGAKRAFGALVGHAVIAGVVNRYVGSNYLYVSRKPESASLLDKLPPWPRYLPILGGVAAGAIALAYLPFARRRDEGA